ncbi:hypothetical protein NL50_00995 [Clostridium acetobutylicum]|nr:hypothetical protein NL50_00995 [Clostridium acetobutylicum]
MEKTIDVTELFSKYINDKHDNINIFINEHTYSPNLDFKNDWLSFAFCAFRTLKKELISNKRINNALVIGSGNGIDAIGLSELFNPRKLYVTDLMKDILPIIKRNIGMSLSNDNVEIIQSDLFENLGGEKFDLIYENLPNIPIVLLNKDIHDGINSSSYISEKYVSNTIYSGYLLDLHYKFLQQCDKYLNHDGYAICNIGVRFPLNIYYKMFSSLNLKNKILVIGLKEQTEAADVLQGYLAASKTYDTQIYYYRLDMPNVYKNRKLILPSEAEKNNYLSSIESAKVSIDEAINLYKKGIKVAHLVFTSVVCK